MPSVLFVCTANRCRSPIAMTLLRDKVKRLASVLDWRIESAGTWTIEGLPAVDGAKLVMAEKGLDLSQHLSHQVTGDMLRSFSLILTMERGQKEALQIEFQEVSSRVFLLSEMVGVINDISDPVGKSLTEFRQTVVDIETLIDQGFARIYQLAQAEPVSD
jgi:protein-tyrosine-phosphatase